MTSRHSLYHFGDYNPYRPSDAERELVLENLARLRTGETGLEGFLKQTPQFPRWQDAHVRRARIMLIINEPGLSDMERLHGDLVAAASVEDVAGCFQQAMFSWLSLTDHPALGCINGEKPWSEGGLGRGASGAGRLRQGRLLHDRRRRAGAVVLQGAASGSVGFSADKRSGYQSAQR